jgi:MFS family permease
MGATQLEDITRTIQLAVAPVFLLSAIGTMLSVLSTRLGRIVDRARRLEARDADDVEPREERVVELKQLERRAKMIYYALTLGVSAAGTVCFLIGAAFIGYLMNTNLSLLVAILFIVAVSLFMAALMFFLREVFGAVAQLRFALPAEVPGSTKQ